MGVRAALLVLVLLAACTPARREVRGDAVRYVRFQGNGGLFSGHNDLQLRAPMVQRQSPPLTFTFPFTYFLTPAPLSIEALRTDARRLEVWYAHHGYFDARVHGWTLRRVRRQTDRLAGVVDVIGHVEPGEVSRVRTLDVTGTWPSALEPVVRSVRRNLTLDVGDPFSLEAVQEAAAAFRYALHDAGYPYATVEHVVDAFPEEHAVDVTFRVDAGILARFGPIRVEGLERLRPELVRWRLAFAPRDVYNLQALAFSRSDLYQTELFSVVDIQPDLSDPTCDEVPVTVVVREAAFRRFRVGGGVVYDYYNLGPTGTLEFRDLHLFGSDWQMRARAGAGAVIGVIEDDSVGGLDQVFFTGLGELRFQNPWFARGRVGLDFGAEFEQDAQFGSLGYRQLDASAAVTWRYDRAITLSGGPVFTWFRYVAQTEATEAASAIRFGGDFRADAYRLLSVDLHLRVDWRDDPIRTRRGSFWGADLRQSIPLAIRDEERGVDDPGFLYTRLEGDARGWWPVRLFRKQRRFPVVMAGRLHGVAMVPWRGEDAPLPHPDLAFLGGPTSLRSFRTNQVGPYDAIAFYPDGRPDPQHNNGRVYDVDVTYVPRGGVFGAEALGELRYDFETGLSVAVFGEFGVLTRRWTEPSAYALRGGGGLGIRYYSPIGPIRLDLGMRPLYPEDFGPARWLGANPVDQLPRGFDLLSGGRRAREHLEDRTFPAINIFLAIGEPF